VIINRNEMAKINIILGSSTAIRHLLLILSQFCGLQQIDFMFLEALVVDWPPAGSPVHALC